MRIVTTTVAVAFAAISWSAPAPAATYLGTAPIERYGDDPRAVASSPVVDGLVGYAVATIEAFPSIDNGFGQAIFSGRGTRVARATAPDQERYLFNFRIPPGSRLTRSRVREGATEVGTMAMVPEPATWALMILGLGLTAAAWRRCTARAKLSRA